MEIYKTNNENIFYTFCKHDFVIPQTDFNKYLTDRQINNLKEKIKKAYTKIVAMKFDQLIGNKTNLTNNIKEYEKYKKYIDIL